jgi:hypothetical protein
MINSFAHFEIRPLDEKFNAEALEKAFNLEFPPLFRVFIETFKIETFKFQGIVHTHENVGFHHFKNPIEKFLAIYKEQGWYYQERQMLPFAISGQHSGGICVGMNGDERDKIFIDNEMYDGRFEIIANNVFEFVRGLQISEG